MRRGPQRRDLGLSVRMGLDLAVYALLYAAFGYLLYRFVGLYGLFVAAVPLFLLSSSEQLVLRAARARSAGQGEELQPLVERLCGLADLPVARVAVIDSDAPNAFVVGLTPARATVVVTRGLLERLEPGELQAVLAHEVSHVANRDALVMTATSSFSVIGAWLRQPGNFPEWIFWPLYAPFYLAGLLVTRALSRYREFIADRGSALLTGAPEQLMSALQKLSSELGRIPSRDLRRAGANALFILPLPSRVRELPLLADHPPLEKRLARLASMAREMGKPVPPWA
jgi:heat shock protein HtpX